MATVYYNSSAGGSNDGTSEANAYTDLQTALNSLSAGDHSMLRALAERCQDYKPYILYQQVGGSYNHRGYASTPVTVECIKLHRLFT